VGTVLFVTWDGGGNVNPVLSLARQLTASGSDVHVLGSASLAGRVTAAGVGFISRDAATEWDQYAAAEDTMDAIDATACDAAVVDYMLPGALCGAEAKGTRTAALVHTLYAALLVDGAPAPISMAASVADLNAFRPEIGLDDISGFGDLLDRCQRVLVVCPQELDVALDVLPRNVRYVGPELETVEPTDEWHPPSGSDDPLVCVSMGTTPMDELAVLEAILDALADRPVRVVATVGDHLDPARIAPRRNATVTRYVKHSLIMRHASLTVTHSGLGTVLSSLAHGVPLLCIPLGRDQPQNAEAVVRCGAGLAIEATTDTSTIGRSVDAVLASDDHRRAAAAMATVIQTGLLDRRGVAEIEALAHSGPHPSGPLVDD